MESLDFLKETEKQLLSVAEKFSSAVRAVMNDLEEQKEEMSAIEKELSSRETNVIRMEKSIRKHQQIKEATEKQLEEASNKQTAAILKMTVLENENAKLQEMMEQLEERLRVQQADNDKLVGKNAELTIMNQKLAEEKAKLLRLQIGQGGE